MKKLVFFLMVLLSMSAFGQSSMKDSSILDDQFIRKNLIGEWKDQNSTTIFKKNGTYSTQFDSGTAEHGKWSVEKNILTMRGELLSSLELVSFAAYNILFFSETKMEYQEIGTQSDNTIWIAFKKVKKRKKQA